MQSDIWPTIVEPSLYVAHVLSQTYELGYFMVNQPTSCFVNSRYHYPVPKFFYVQLSVGSHEFIGEGRTRQAARHNAAMKALQALRNEPIPERPPQVNT